MKTTRSALGFALVLLAADSWAQTPAGTAFTYQGRLTDGASPAQGTYDLQLTLFPGPSGGVAVGGPLLRDDVPVTSGLFTVLLDFGAGPFAGNARWLEIGVRPGASSGAFTVLAPRQELTPAPHAVFAQAAPWSGLSGVPPGFADGVDNDSGGDITSVTAGAGLAGGVPSGDAALAVAFAGTGAATSASRSDHHHDGTYAAAAHDHLGQAWSGSAPTALGVTTSGLTGLRGETSSAVGRGVFGLASSTTGNTSGVWGEAASAQGRAVIGRATATSGINYGVWGESFSTLGRGVHGLALATTGASQGVWGESASSAGRGVYGLATATAGATFGVFGFTSSPDGTGVYGVHNAASGTEAGVHGETTSTTSAAAGVLGRVTSSAPGGNSAAVRGINEGTGTLGIGVWGSQAGGGWGVQGTTVSGIGVRGAASSSAGVGVRAVGSGTTGTALEISSGAIRVTGAGVGTNTAATVLVIGSSQLCGFPLPNRIILDNPYSNDDPDAIVLVTPSTGANTAFVSYNATAGSCPAGRWLVSTLDASIDIGDRYNVLIIKP